MKPKYITLTAVTVIAILLDQISKMWAKDLMMRPPITVIDNFFHFVYVENRGAAWGLFGDLPEIVRIPFFILVSIGAIIFITFFFRKLNENNKLAIFSLSMILGGALGNFIDRVAYNYVIDFVDWHYYNYHWPTFNVADVFISVGVGLLVLEIIFGKSELSIRYRPPEDETNAVG